MNIFDSENYRKWIKSRLHSMPKQGHGQSRKLALYLNVSTTLVSQVLAEEKHFTLDQAHLCTEFFLMNELESRFFMLLVQFEKASSSSFKQKLEREMTQSRNESLKLEKRLSHQNVLSDEQKAIFYSDWFYSAIRLSNSITQYQTPQAIADYLKLPIKLVSETLLFLEQAGLVIHNNGTYKMGPQSTHIGADSKWVKLHHQNWRQKAIEQLNYPNPQKLHYSSPMTLSAQDAERIRKILVDAIDEAGKIVDDSPAEQLMCLNLDWFLVGKK